MLLFILHSSITNQKYVSRPILYTTRSLWYPTRQRPSILHQDIRLVHGTSISDSSLRPIPRVKKKIPTGLINNFRNVSVYPHERVGDITMVAAFSGLFGAKMFAIFESSENLSQFLANPIGEFFSPGGLAIYGGLICGFIGVFIYVKRWLKIKPIYVMDAVAPALMFAYGVGRIGCQLSGDGDWGIPNKLAQPTWWFLPKWTWAFDYPNNVTNSSRTPHEIIAGFQGIYNTHLTEPVFPTPFYETILAFMIGGFLWSIRKRLKVPGTLFMIYLILNGLERFFIEKIRVNDKINSFGIQFTQAELIAVLLFITGIIGIIVLNSRANKTIDIKAV
jgi:phosphatidylglycerol---prolipoprotein diacylglyceryl transferase